MSLADQLTLARAAAVPLVIVLFAWDFVNHNWWATAVFIAAMSTNWLDGHAIGGFAAAGAWDDTVAWWALLVALVLTWLSGLDYARLAPGLLRGRPVSP